MPKTLLSLIAFIGFAFQQHAAQAQEPVRKITYSEYIRTYKDIAIRKMHEFKIPASIILAQGLLESGSGNSELTVNANNHFGIKCHKEWTGMTYTMDDDEKNECFRKYASAEESYNDHSYFLTSRPRYAFLFELDIRDYKGWAYGLKNAGYATNPRYAEMLIKIIEDNELYLFDSDQGTNVASRQQKKQPDAAQDYSEDYATAKNASFRFLEVAEANRKIYVNNNVRLTYARPGDTPFSIAHDLGIHTFQILQYNELGKNEAIQPGQVIYVEPKKRKAAEKMHTFRTGETMREISQRYGVKLKALYKKNRIAEGHEPEPGTVLYLQKNKPQQR